MDLPPNKMNKFKDGVGKTADGQNNSSPDTIVVENVETQAAVCDACGAQPMPKRRQTNKKRHQAMAAKSVRRNKKKTAASCVPTKRRAAVATHKIKKAAMRKRNKKTC